LWQSARIRDRRAGAIACQDWACGPSDLLTDKR
jgi:hypothetical protein